MKHICRKTWVKSQTPFMICNSFGKSSTCWLKAPVIMVKIMYINEKNEVNLSKNISKSFDMSLSSVSLFSKCCISANPMIKAVKKLNAWIFIWQMKWGRININVIILAQTYLFFELKGKKHEKQQCNEQSSYSFASEYRL